jgi:hypothetical protein
MFTLFKSMGTLKGALFFVLAVIIVSFAAWSINERFGSHTLRYTLPASAAMAFERLDGGKTIKYKGQDGKTVLELLQQASKIEVDPVNPANVLRIAGKKVSPPETSWVFLIDSQEQSTPAGETTTKNGQLIEWQVRSNN